MCMWRAVTSLLHWQHIITVWRHTLDLVTSKLQSTLSALFSSSRRSPSDIYKSFQAAVRSFGAQPPAGSRWWVEEAGWSRSERSRMTFQDVSFLPVWVAQAVGKRGIWEMEGKKCCNTLRHAENTCKQISDVTKRKRWCHELIGWGWGHFCYFLDLHQFGTGWRWQWRRLSFPHHLLDQWSGASWLGNRHVVTHFFDINPPQWFLWNVTWSASVIVMSQFKQKKVSRCRCLINVIYSTTCWTKAVTTCSVGINCMTNILYTHEK